MAMATDARQITLYVPTEVLAEVDAQAVDEFHVRNGRTKWILKAVSERLGREGRDPGMDRLCDLYRGLGAEHRAMLARFAEFLAEDARRHNQ